MEEMRTFRTDVRLYLVIQFKDRKRLAQQILDRISSDPQMFYDNARRFLEFYSGIEEATSSVEKIAIVMDAIDEIDKMIIMLSTRFPQMRISHEMETPAFRSVFNERVSKYPELFYPLWYEETVNEPKTVNHGDLIWTKRLVQDWSPRFTADLNFLKTKMETLYNQLLFPGEASRAFLLFEDEDGIVSTFYRNICAVLTFFESLSNNRTLAEIYWQYDPKFSKEDAWMKLNNKDMCILSERRYLLNCVRTDRIERFADFVDREVMVEMYGSPLSEELLFSMLKYFKTSKFKHVYHKVIKSSKSGRLLEDFGADIGNDGVDMTLKTTIKKSWQRLMPVFSDLRIPSNLFYAWFKRLQEVYRTCDDNTLLILTMMFEEDDEKKYKLSPVQRTHLKETLSSHMLESDGESKIVLAFLDGVGTSMKNLDINKTTKKRKSCILSISHVLRDPENYPEDYELKKSAYDVLDVLSEHYVEDKNFNGPDVVKVCRELISNQSIIESTLKQDITVQSGLLAMFLRELADVINMLCKFKSVQLKPRERAWIEQIMTYLDKQNWKTLTTVDIPSDYVRTLMKLIHRLMLPGSLDTTKLFEEISAYLQIRDKLFVALGNTNEAVDWSNGVVGANRPASHAFGSNIIRTHQSLLDGINLWTEEMVEPSGCDYPLPPMPKWLAFYIYRSGLCKGSFHLSHVPKWFRNYLTSHKIVVDNQNSNFDPELQQWCLEGFETDKIAYLNDTGLMRGEPGNIIWRPFFKWKSWSYWYKMSLITRFHCMNQSMQGRERLVKKMINFSLLSIVRMSNLRKISMAKEDVDFYKFIQVVYGNPRVVCNPDGLIPSYEEEKIYSYHTALINSIGYSGSSNIFLKTFQREDLLPNGENEIIFPATIEMMLNNGDHSIVNMLISIADPGQPNELEVVQRELGLQPVFEQMMPGFLFLGTEKLPEIDARIPDSWPWFYYPGWEFLSHDLIATPIKYSFKLPSMREIETIEKTSFDNDALCLVSFEKIKNLRRDFMSGEMSAYNQYVERLRSWYKKQFEKTEINVAIRHVARLKYLYDIRSQLLSTLKQQSSQRQKEASPYVFDELLDEIKDKTSEEQVKIITDRIYNSLLEDVEIVKPYEQLEALVQITNLLNKKLYGFKLESEEREKPGESTKIPGAPESQLEALEMFEALSEFIENNPDNNFSKVVDETLNITKITFWSTQLNDKQNILLRMLLPDNIPNWLESNADEMKSLLQDETLSKWLIKKGGFKQSDIDFVVSDLWVGKAIEMFVLFVAMNPDEIITDRIIDLLDPEYSSRWLAILYKTEYDRFEEFFELVEIVLSERILGGESFEEPNLQDVGYLYRWMKEYIPNHPESGAYMRFYEMENDLFEDWFVYDDWVESHMIDLQLLYDRLPEKEKKITAMDQAIADYWYLLRFMRDQPDNSLFDDIEELMGTAKNLSLQEWKIWLTWNDDNLRRLVERTKTSEKITQIIPEVEMMVLDDDQRVALVLIVERISEMKEDIYFILDELVDQFSRNNEYKLFESDPPPFVSTSKYKNLGVLSVDQATKVLQALKSWSNDEIVSVLSTTFDPVECFMKYPWFRYLRNYWLDPKARPMAIKLTPETIDEYLGNLSRTNFVDRYKVLQSHLNRLILLGEPKEIGISATITLKARKPSKKRSRLESLLPSTQKLNGDGPTSLWIMETIDPTINPAVGAIRRSENYLLGLSKPDKDITLAYPEMKWPKNHISKSDLYNDVINDTTHPVALDLIKLALLPSIDRDPTSIMVALKDPESYNYVWYRLRLYDIMKSNTKDNSLPRMAECRPSLEKSLVIIIEENYNIRTYITDSIFGDQVLDVDSTLSFGAALVFMEEQD